MKMTIKKRFCAWTLTAVLTAVSFAQPAAAFGLETQGTDDVAPETVDQISYENIFQKDTDGVKSNMNYLKDSDQVRIIVELEKEPLLAYSGQMQAYASASDFISSEEGQSLEAALAQDRKIVEKQIIRSVDGVSGETLYEYSAVFNGFAIDAKYGALEDIRNMDGVKNAFVSNVYELIKPVENQPYMSGSVPTIGGDIAQDTGYTGKGTVVAIVDTGIDVDHEAFQYAVNSPKYTKDDIKTLIATQRLNTGSLSVEALYKNAKVPFAYDYADVDTNVYGTQSHGTHVAGIVGAAAGEVTGVAPDAQFLIMKVFGDATEGAYDSDILAALDDSVKLGADVINMSLGTTAGFSKDSDITLQEVYDRIESSGINLMCAAGNEYNAAYKNSWGNDLPLVENPDSSVVASPSTYSAALSVASSNNVKMTSIYFTAGGERYCYKDSSEKSALLFTALESKSPLAYTSAGYGSTADFAAADVKGKIALIQRGGEEAGEILTFAQKEANAAEAGAVGAIVYDNVDGELVSMALDNQKIPCVFISKADGEKLIAGESKGGTIAVSENFIGEFQDKYSGKISDFSSWGVSHDLKLKPEITAPGGNIYSTLLGGKYGNMSGTSMASPHLAGAAAIMEQYISDELDGTNMTAKQRAMLANNLLMSTAVPIKDDGETPNSPRQQGAGLIQIQRAVTTSAYLIGSDGGRPKAELGESEDGSFSFGFVVNNMKSQPIKYQAEVTALVETTVEENGRTFIAQKSRKLTADEITVEIPSTVQLDGNGTTSVSVKLALTEQGKKNLEVFSNGTFIDGFVRLTPVTGDTVSLGLPFMGFYGDWSEIPIFDSTAYDDQQSTLVEMTLNLFDYDDSGYALGKNIYVSADKSYDANKIAVKPNKATSIIPGVGYKHITAVCGLLRNADKITYEAFDLEGNLMHKDTDTKVRKSYYMTTSGTTSVFRTPMEPNGWFYMDEWNSDLPDGQYTYTVTGTIDDTSEKVSFPVTIDSEPPQVVKSKVVTENGKNLWKVTVSDNHYVQAVRAVSSDANTMLTSFVAVNEKEPGTETELVFDLSEPAFSGLTSAKIALVDYADNQVVTDSFSLIPEEIVDPVDEKASASVYAVENVSVESRPVFRFAMKELKKAATVTFSFDVKGELSGDSDSDQMIQDCVVSGMNGFTLLDGIKWSDSQKKSGKITLCYLQGEEKSLTVKELTDIASMEIVTSGDGSVSLKLTDVLLSGFDDNGKEIWIESEIGSAAAFVQVGKGDLDKFDVNKDGVVDQLDITFCQLYYRVDKDSSQWEKASVCDVDGNGSIGIEDMILIIRDMNNEIRE